MSWSSKSIFMQDFSNYGIDSGNWSPADGFKGLLLGMASAPLLLVSIYFFKASPRFFSKEHGISLLAYMSSTFLASLGVLLFGLPSVMTSFQILPILNQIFVSSFTLSVESVSATILTIASIFLGIRGYSQVEKVSDFSWFGIIMFLCVLGLAVFRLTSHGEELKRKFDLENISDLFCMLLLSFEAAVGFGALCSFSYIFSMTLPIVALATSMAFLLSMEKALYYYPATAVIPIFTVFLRFFAAFLSIQMYKNSFNIYVSLSLIIGSIASIFPLILP